MRILFYPRDLDSGDSQRSAVELAGAMVENGHEVTILGGPGLLADRARELGVDVVEVPERRRWCGLRSMRQLSTVARVRDVDVIHAFEWESITKAFIATQLCRTQAAITGSVHSRTVPPVLPRTVPLLMSSRDAAAARRSAGYIRVGVLEPWVDTVENAPAAYDRTSELRERWGLDRHGSLITVVTNSDGESSTATLATVLDAVGDIAAQDIPVQLLVIGDGPRRVLAEERAEELSYKFERTIVVAAGEMVDRGEAYAAADVVIGSDSSVLHGMAFGKPVIIEGELGYFRAVNHATAEQFVWSGWYGVGTGTEAGKAELLNALEPLLDSSRLREYRGLYSRELAENYGLDEAVLRQLQEYRDALDTRVGRVSAWLDLGRVVGRLLIRRGVGRIRPRLRDRSTTADVESTAQISSKPSSDTQMIANVRTHEGSGYDGNLQH